MNLNIFAAIRTLFATLITMATSLNRAATIMDKGLIFVETKIDFELADQKAAHDQLATKRDMRTQKRVQDHDAAWELDAPTKPKAKGKSAK